MLSFLFWAVVSYLAFWAVYFMSLGIMTKIEGGSAIPTDELDEGTKSGYPAQRSTEPKTEKDENGNR